MKQILLASFSPFISFFFVYFVQYDFILFIGHWQMCVNIYFCLSNISNAKMFCFEVKEERNAI